VCRQCVAGVCVSENRLGLHGSYSRSVCVREQHVWLRGVLQAASRHRQSTNIYAHVEGRMARRMCMFHGHGGMAVKEACCRMLKKRETDPTVGVVCM